jgi:C4-dicarboxylate-specific signal transduction histidine kinase
VTARVVHEARRLKLSVVDNGIGILPENLTRIFGQGFATRRKGRGFGLHASAIAAREIGATLVAQSDGPGSGATFTLELPLPSGEEKLQDPGLKNVPPPQNQA